MNFMLQTRRRRFSLYALTIVSGMALSCLVLGLIGYNSNQRLPKEPGVTDRMTALDKIRLAESLHLKAEIGDAVWPGYAGMDGPVIIWNNDYEFLFGMSDPPADWEAVPGDNFEGQPYYRRPAGDPQNFAVQIGDQWASSIFTKYHVDQALISGIRELLPPVIAEIFPYKIFIQPSELQISGVQHEYFHVVQATTAPEKFSKAEASYLFGERYWLADADMQSAWQEEISWLIKAVGASSDREAGENARSFLATRDRRRRDFALDDDLVAYEVDLEWLEGLAKYVELRSWQEAGANPAYSFLPEMGKDPDFDEYKSYQSHWKQELRQTRRQAGQEGDLRFYYTGMLQAFLLDRLMPGWKEQIMAEGVTLEALLRTALAK